MIVFKTFWKVAWHHKFIIAIYALIVMVFAVYSTQSGGGDTYVVTKPKIAITNHDNSAIATGLTDYIEKNSQIKSYGSDDEINDAIFYRDLDYAIEIPTGFGDKSLHDSAELNIKKTDGYGSVLAERLVDKYTKLVAVYKKDTDDQSEIIQRVNQTLNQKVDVAMKAKVDATALQKMTYYYNFMAYAVLGGIVYILCAVLASFRRDGVQRRTTIGAMRNGKFMGQIVGASVLVSLVLWLLFVVMGAVLVGSVAWSGYGLLMALNLLIFTGAGLGLALLIASITTNRDAISGIVNVVALGQAFTCGAFIPVSMLPDSLLTVAHVLPAYWYINANGRIAELTNIDGTHLVNIGLNWLIMLVFAVLFVVIAGVVIRRRQQG